MPVQYVLLPLFVEVLLTFGLMLGMMYFRTSSLRRGETRFKDIALREPNWPPRAQQFANAFSNQFELPVLFYVLTVLSIITHHADLVYLVLAWIFVADARASGLSCMSPTTTCRCAAPFYGVGALVLLAMWLIFIVRILAGLP